MATRMDRLVPLADLSGYKIADGDPDPRGWAVLASDGTRLGRIDDLIVDPEARAARYFDVLLDEDTVLDHREHILVPADAVHIGEEEHQEKQIALAATTEDVRALPRYQGLPLTPEQAAEYRAGRPTTGPPRDRAAVRPGEPPIDRGGGSRG